MYDTDKYNARKINDFISALSGLRQSMRVRDTLGQAEVKSAVIKRIVNSFPDMAPLLEFFDNAFDPSQAKRDGVIKPKEGVDPEYDETKEVIAELEEGFARYLKEQRQRLGCNDIKYWGNGSKDRLVSC